jgi:hypothetical protein
MSIKNAAVFIATTTMATAGLYGVLDWTSTHAGMEPMPMPIAYVSHAKPVSHEACWTETNGGTPAVVCNSSDKWAEWTARCIETALADHIPGPNNEIAQGCMAEADKHSNDS